ncbi:MAG TPA: glycosyltransferase [Isosphaeraceae bacterium]|nr:glycosyltransferase [Isosphaeraceae bacterium]
MRVLFVHRAFPSQFGHLAAELARRYGWTCRFLAESVGHCPPPSAEMLARVEVRTIPTPAESRVDRVTPWTQAYGRYVELAQAVAEAARALPGGAPDLVVGHLGLGPTLFLRDLWDCPIINYCEYYFARQRRDLTYRIDLPPAQPAPFYPRAINASSLSGLLAIDAGYAPTAWQRDSFPGRFRPKIEVHFDGIDTELYRPRDDVPRQVAGRSIPEGTRVVTYVARGLESMRGFDLFMRVAGRIARERADVLFVVAGGEGSYYAWDRLHTGSPSFKDWVLSRGDYDPSRFVFLGQVEPERLAEVLALSDLHFYLTVPFCLSWSLFDAMACGAVVLAADVGPVRELVAHGRNGLLAPLFDEDVLVETSLRVLDDPAAFADLGREARRHVEGRYSLDVAIPELAGFFRRVASLRHV